MPGIKIALKTSGLEGGAPC